MAKDPKDKDTEDFLLRYDLNNRDIDWQMPHEIPDISMCNYVSIDLETYDPNLKTKGPGWMTGDGFIAGVSVACATFSGYFPVQHKNGPNMDRGLVLRWVKDIVENPLITKVFHHAMYDLGWLRNAGIHLKGPVICTMVTAPLIDENRMSYSLDNLCRAYLTGVRKDESALRLGAKEWGLDPKADMWQLPARYVGGYATQDAVATLQLCHHQRGLIEEQSLGTVFDLEMRLVPALLDVQATGIAVDLDFAEQSKKTLAKRKAEQLSFIQQQTGMKIDLWASDSLVRVFDHLQIPYNRTEPTAAAPDGNPSFTKDFLNAVEHPVAAAIIAARECDKAEGTFIDGICSHAHNGRIYCSINQLRSDDGGTVTGRLSISNPSLQNMPARDPVTRAYVRGIFRPEVGETWDSYDYQSQEPALLVHFAASMPDRLRPEMVDELVRQYNSNTKPDLHQVVADLAGLTRKEAKTINLGVMYGMGVNLLADRLGVTYTSAQLLMSRYHTAVPFVKIVSDAAMNRAREHGSVRTVLGRVGHFDLWEPSGYGVKEKALPHNEAVAKWGSVGRFVQRAFTYRALNKIIQGSAADQMKKAMVDCWESGYRPLLSIHDELCFSGSNDEARLHIKEIMETGINLKVPIGTDMQSVENWGQVV